MGNPGINLNRNFFAPIVSLVNRGVLFDASKCGVDGRLLVKSCIYNGKLGDEHKVYQPLDISEDFYFSSDPELQLARKYRSIWLNVDGLKAPGVKPATKIDYGIGDAWEFTDGTDDTVVGKIDLPLDMKKDEDMNILIGWSTPTANAGNCIWQVEYLFRQENEAMDAAADATLSNTVAASAVANGLVVSDIGWTAVPNVNDKCLSVRIKRRADLAGDSLNEDNHFYGICFVYTSNSRGTTP